MESATLEGTEHRPPWSNASTPSAILAASLGFKKLRSIGAMSYSQARWVAVASTSVARRLPSKSCKRSRQILHHCGRSLLRSLLGAKRTWACALHMSAFDPKRTWGLFKKPTPPLPTCYISAAKWLLDLGERP